MKRILSIFLACALFLSACSTSNNNVDLVISNEQIDIISDATEVDSEIKSENAVQKYIDTGDKETNNYDFNVSGLDDENLLRYVEGHVYSELVKQFDSEDYFVENVEAIYYPKEYIEALASNSQANVYFGYTAAELDTQFQGTKYVFTLGENGQTIVVPMETLTDDVFVKALEDVIVGTGVILVCVTVSIVASPAAPAVSMIFAASASTGTAFALESGAISFAAAAITKGYETENLEQALRAGVEASGEGFKWGAITGGVTGGTVETFTLVKGAKHLTMNQVAMIQKESGYPANVIKQFHNMDEYQVFKNANLKTEMISNKLALVRNDIDLDYIDPQSGGLTNLQLMKKGKAPYDPTGKKYELHHIGQESDGTLAVLTSAEHDSAALHGFKESSVINRSEFNKTRELFWKDMAKYLS